MAIKSSHGKFTRIYLRAYPGPHGYISLRNDVLESS
jgi:hypothetical protein